jgi:hypothetical protein
MRIAAYVDPGRPMAWREEPYYSTLKHWARNGAEIGQQVVAQVNNRVVVLLPDEDVDLGPIGPDERVVTRASSDGHRIHYEALKLHKDDPIISGVPDNKLIKPFRPN